MVSIPRLYTTDLEALHHILHNYFDYQKPESTRFALSRLLGNGVLVMEGEHHKFQRRVMNAAFGPTQVKLVIETFYDKSLLLRDLWASRMSDSGGSSSANVEAFDGLTRATLDIIGLAGFGYDFSSLNENKKSELYEAFSVVIKSGSTSAWRILQAQFAPLRILPSFSGPAFKQAKETMARIGNELLAEAKKVQDTTEGKADAGAKDLLSLLIKSNTNSGVPEGQRMSDEDVLAQVPTFLIAGHETTTTSTTWALYNLCLHQDVQAKLREELLNVGTDQPSMEEINTLSYFDHFVHEVLRLYSPIPNTVRVAAKDDVIPLKEGYTDLKGKFHENFLIKKGEGIFIPIYAVNRDKKLWGEDAAEFKPERWEKLPDAVNAVPSVWGNMMTFLGGSRACIGWRFSLIEMKVLLFTLIRAFEFKLAVSEEDVSVLKMGVVLRPVVKGIAQLPLVISPVKDN
ncbi:cytochrome P450 [Gymnopus androsaceus JB14]|uniref:Cytochrome P450 n=1 Tax=Gymnopus androsaceus JB14 TaxID=1447944 RepID=A0A6A4H2I3_9AGAR|nr:cytochrome P450 [Gymnopus androsaceus JB14]